MTMKLTIKEFEIFHEKGLIVRVDSPGKPPVWETQGGERVEIEDGPEDVVNEILEALEGEDGGLFNTAAVQMAAAILGGPVGVEISRTTPQAEFSRTVAEIACNVVDNLYESIHG